MSTAPQPMLHSAAPLLEEIAAAPAELSGEFLVRLVRTIRPARANSSVDAPALVRTEAVTRVREIIAMQALITGRDVVVVPVLISRGRVSREKFMEDLKGLPVIYAGDPILPHPLVADWIATRVRETAR